jgi:ABC-type antimicrobial peptide transport system permease subunit
MAKLPDWLAESGELVLDALQEIRGHKLRSLLTLSGIVFGSASLVAMTSLAQGMKSMAYRDLEKIGFPNAFTVSHNGPRSDARRAAALRDPGMKLADLDALERMPGVTAVHPRNWGGNYVVTGPAGRRMMDVEGIDADYLEIRNYRLVSGRSFRPLDIENVSRVAILGEDLVKDLFGNAAPVGRMITIDGVRFTVIGVVAPMSFEMAPIDFSWVARQIYLPWTYFTRYYQASGHVDQALVMVQDSAALGELLRSGQLMLRQRHGGVEDFDIDNENAEILSDLAIADRVLGGWNGVMYAIALVTLVVGGIGLFSVLLISVRERVREIGIRKALGADDGDIKRLFMAESLTLSFLGAVIGVGAGAGLIFVTIFIGRQFGKEFLIPVHLPGAVLAIGFALVTGVIFGWYPARRAAKLDPIEAISN